MISNQWPKCICSALILLQEAICRVHVSNPPVIPCNFFSFAWMLTGVWWDHSGCVYGQGLPCGMLPLRGLWDGTERWRWASLLPSGWPFALSLLSSETHREWHNPSSCVPASLRANVADSWEPWQTICYVIALFPPSVDFLCMFFSSQQFSCERIWEIFAGLTESVRVWVPAVPNSVYLTRNVARYLNWSVYSYVPFSAAWRFLWAHFGRFFSESTTCYHANGLSHVMHN